MPPVIYQVLFLTWTLPFDFNFTNLEHSIQHEDSTFRIFETSYGLTLLKKKHPKKSPTLFSDQHNTETLGLNHLLGGRDSGFSPLKYANPSCGRIGNSLREPIRFHISCVYLPYTSYEFWLFGIMEVGSHVKASIRL